MSDRDHLARAVALARGDEWRTSPNPTVGCVLVGPDGSVVGEGRTEPAGGRHAEVVALDAAGEGARGAAAFVTLEPCDHVGRTGPCSVALRDAGVARVVVARRDPVPGHRGGLDTLRTAGVEVSLVADDGWGLATASRFLRRARTGRSWLTLKVAHGLDGATVPGDGRWITGGAARRRVHAQRATHDAVLVGVGTVLADDPRLDVRHVPATGRQPRPVVLDSTARTPADAVVVARGAVVVVAEDAPAERVRGLRVAGAEVVEVASDDDGRRVDPVAALRAVAGLGLHAVYAEPGDTLATALVVAGCVDELVLHRPLGPLRSPPVAWAAGRWRRTSCLAVEHDREDVWRPVTPVPRLLDEVATWAREQPDVRALALVGSHARGTAGPGADVDLVAVVDDPAARVADRSWVDELGAVVSTTVEDWGLVTSLRLRRLDGTELELGLAGPTWSTPPLDAATADVVRAGLRPLLDPDGSLARAVAWAAAAGRG